MIRNVIIALLSIASLMPSCGNAMAFSDSVFAAGIHAQSLEHIKVGWHPDSSMQMNPMVSMHKEDPENSSLDEPAVLDATADCLQTSPLNDCCVSGHRTSQIAVPERITTQKNVQQTASENFSVDRFSMSDSVNGTFSDHNSTAPPNLHSRGYCDLVGIVKRLD